MPFIRKALESRFMARVENHKKDGEKSCNLLLKLLRERLITDESL
jgi:hypothetical protein